MTPQITDLLNCITGLQLTNCTDRSKPIERSPSNYISTLATPRQSVHSTLPQIESQIIPCRVCVFSELCSLITLHITVQNILLSSRTEEAVLPRVSFNFYKQRHSISKSPRKHLITRGDSRTTLPCGPFWVVCWGYPWPWSCSLGGASARCRAPHRHSRPSQPRPLHRPPSLVLLTGSGR